MGSIVRISAPQSLGTKGLADDYSPAAGQVNRQGGSLWDLREVAIGPERGGDKSHWFRRDWLGLAFEAVSESLLALKSVAKECKEILRTPQSSRQTRR